MISFLIRNKDAILAVQSIVATFAYIIAGVWAIRRISYERPFQSLLNLEASSMCSAINSDLLLLHVQITVKNVGRSVVVYGDTADGDYRSSITVKGIRKNITLPAGMTLQSNETTRLISWKNEQFFITLFDGPFNELFKDWFEGSTSVTLEAGESEQYSFDCLVRSEISEVSVAVKIYETTIKNRKIGRPYYWLIQEVIPLTITKADSNPLT